MTDAPGLPQLAQPSGAGDIGADVTNAGNKALAEMEERVKEK